MSDLLFPMFIVLLGISKLFEVVSSLRDPRRPPTRILEAAAHLLFSLFFIITGTSIYLQDQESFSRLIPWVTVFIVNGILLIAWLGLKARILSLRRKHIPEAVRADITARVLYSDVTGDAQALASANRPEAMVRALEGLGYRSVCLLRTSTLPDDDTPLSEVNELFSSPDGRAYAEPETFFAREAVALRTMLSDGAIVDTTLLLDPAQGSSPFQRWLVRLRWPRRNRPGAGYYFDRMEDKRFDLLQARHVERLERIARERGAHIPPHTTFERYVDLSRQGLRISADGTLVDLLIIVLTLPLAVFLPLLLALALHSPDITRAWFYLAAAPLALVVPWIAVQWSRHLPTPVLSKMSGFITTLNAFLK